MAMEAQSVVDANLFVPASEQFENLVARLGGEETTMSISEYIDGFYNPTRRHSTLNYVSPIEFELLQSVKRAA